MSLSGKLRDGKTVLDGLRQAGSMRVMFPRSADLTGVLVNCAGGMTGGDRFEVAATAGPGTALTLTSQTAERMYRANGPTPARLTTTLAVEDGAALHWLPQETILFDGSRMRRALNVHLAPGARFVMIEPLVFGRTAMQERLTSASFRDSLRIYRDCALIHADATRLEGDVDQQLSRAALTSGGLAVASVVLAHPEAETFLARARDLIGPHGGASLKARDLLSIRLIAADAQQLRRVAVQLIPALTGAALPRTWTM